MGKVSEYYREIEELGINPMDRKPSKSKWDDYIPELIEESNKFNRPISDVIKAKKEELSQDL